MYRSSEILAAATAAARSAGRLLQDLQPQIRPREKAPADLVTDADFASQRAIRSRLTQEFPEYSFIGEEDSAADRAAGSAAIRDGSPCWIVDPLDGTTNYVHGLDNYSVSIALRHRNEMLLGVVYDPVRDQLFSAIKGAGACLNGRALATSSVERLDQALVAASFSAKVPPDSPEVARFVQVLPICQAIRRLGSAALNLCYVGAGFMDGYWATSVKLWDVAAGLLIVQEAGGTVTSIDGRALDWDDPRFLASATPPLHAELLAALRLA